MSKARAWFLELNSRGELIGFARADHGLKKEELFSRTPPVGIEREIVTVEESILPISDAEIERKIKRESRKWIENSETYEQTAFIKGAHFGLTLRKEIDEEAIEAKAWREVIDLLKSYRDSKNYGDLVLNEGKRRGVKL